MSKITRYDLNFDDNGDATMDDGPYGDYVLYKDYTSCFEALKIIIEICIEQDSSSDTVLDVLRVAIKETT